jgi:simple sugar transport system permease protein
MIPGQAAARSLGARAAGIAAALLLAALVLAACGYSVPDALGALWSGATGLEQGPPHGRNDVAMAIGRSVWHLNRFALAQSLARTTPLLLAGCSVAIALRAGLFNIGAQGQMVVGALAAAVVGASGSRSAPTLTGLLIHVGLTLAAGAAAGAMWGALAGLLKAARGVHEVLTTIMLNYIALDGADYLVTHGLKDPLSHSMAPQTASLVHSATMPALVPGSNLTAGLGIAIAIAVLFSLFIRRTATGFRIRALGLQPETTAATGMPVVRTTIIAMALAGGLAGLAGALEVAGVHHRFVRGVAASYGFDGIAVALLGGLDGAGMIGSALFFGLLTNGAIGMQSRTDVPAAISTIVQAIVIFLIGIRMWQGRQPDTTAPEQGMEAADAIRS